MILVDIFVTLASYVYTFQNTLSKNIRYFQLFP